MASEALPQRLNISMRIYRVRRGDTLWSIAQRELKDPNRWREIAADNRIGEHPRRPGVYEIYPNEPLLLRTTSNAPQAERERSLSSRAPRLDQTWDAHTARWDVCRVDGSGARPWSVSPEPRAQAFRPAVPLGKTPQAPAKPSMWQSIKDTLGGIAHAAAVIKFPAGIKTKIFEQVVAQGSGWGYKYELAVSGEIKLQQHGDIEWWSDPKSGAIEYEQQLRLSSGDQVINLLGGYEIEGISTNPTAQPSIKVMLFGIEVGSQSQKVYAKAPTVWVYEFETKQQLTRDGVDYVLELSNELTVTFLPPEQLKPAYRRVLVSSGQLLTLLSIAWGLRLAAASTRALSTIGEALRAISLHGATIVLPVIIVTPELQQYLDNPGHGSVPHT